MLNTGPLTNYFGAGSVFSYINCDDDVHVGNPIIVLPGNQEVISQQCQSSRPLSLQTEWGPSFPLLHLGCPHNILSE